jgi:hypothetical protein
MVNAREVCRYDILTLKISTVEKVVENSNVIVIEFKLPEAFFDELELFLSQKICNLPHFT